MDLPELLGLIWGGIVPGVIVSALVVNVAANNVVETYQTARNQPRPRGKR